MNLLAFNTLRDRCHTASREAGWWNDGIPSSKRFATVPDRYLVPTKLCLIHSEISEAATAYFNGTPDDHLSELPGYLVEFADTLIRTADLAGWLKLDMSTAIAQILQCDRIDSSSLGTHAFLQMHNYTSDAMEGFRKNAHDDLCVTLPALNANLARLIIRVDAFARAYGFDLDPIIDAKLAYNATRLDHKLEVRKAEGGKSF